ncbi:ReoY family proteolytic degradation factor [Kurthia massiliensis]|uniref:ReoY family proteolytic degradation factor n=1 Tax=Kurthia massiliensis TaxID=1033739 RepID=UPI0002896FE8|nr:ReoY family proteolytic degradation factor [Kurthia massiliensis]
METSVSNKDKKTFVRWFLKRFDLKRRECVWILNYIVGHEELLSRVHFVEDAHYCPRAIVMSTTESSGIPFRFYKGNIMTADPEKSFHDLRMNIEKDIYIQLNFPKQPPTDLYLVVVEENPYIPSYMQISSEDKKVAQSMLQKSMYEFQQQKLLADIDVALDAGDKETFLTLSAQLKQLNEQR